MYVKVSKQHWHRGADKMMKACMKFHYNMSFVPECCLSLRNQMHRLYIILAMSNKVGKVGQGHQTIMVLQSWYHDITLYEVSL